MIEVSRLGDSGISLVAQWVRNPVYLWLLLWLGFQPWPRNFYMLQAWPKKKKKKKEEEDWVTLRAEALCYGLNVSPTKNAKVLTPSTCVWDLIGE